MNKATLTPEESLLLITKTIEETKEKLKENGHIIILWGIVTFTVFLSQYILEILDLYKVMDIMWTTILFPLGAIYTFVYFLKKVKKEKLPKTIISRTIATMGWVVGINLMILGFAFGHQLGQAIAPVFLILISLFLTITGTSLKFKPLIIGGILVNIIGFATFLLDMDYHGFSMMLGSVVGLVVPGILLNNTRSKENV